MPIPDFHQYSVGQEDEVTEKVDAAATQLEFAEDVFMAAVWRLSRDPDCGQIVEGTTANPERRLINLPPNKIAKSPGLLVRYYMGRDKHGYAVVMIDWVKYYDYDEERAVSPKSYAL